MPLCLFPEESWLRAHRSIVVLIYGSCCAERNAGRCVPDLNRPTVTVMTESRSSHRKRSRSAGDATD
ncbi:MAG: hypothetical protein U0936_28095 [Planctomycetaceae bacterium]